MHIRVKGIWGWPNNNHIPTANDNFQRFHFLKNNFQKSWKIKYFFSTKSFLSIFFEMFLSNNLISEIIFFYLFRFFWKFSKKKWFLKIVFQKIYSSKIDSKIFLKILFRKFFFQNFFFEKNVSFSVFDFFWKFLAKLNFWTLFFWKFNLRKPIRISWDKIDGFLK